MVKFSVCSWIFGNQLIEDTINYVAEVGYDQIELDAATAIRETVKVKKLINEVDISIGGITGDAAWPNLSKDLANPDVSNRKKAIQYFKEQLKVAGELRAKYLVVCPSAVGKTTLYGENSEDWKWAIDSVQQLCNTATIEETDLIIEPVNRYESSIVNSANDAYQFVNEIKHSKVKMLVDTYHMNIEETNSVDAIKEVADKLAVFHVADNNRKGLGMGQINFNTIFTALTEIQYKGPVVLECMASGANPFSANKKEMHDLNDYVEQSLICMKKLYSKNI